MNKINRHISFNEVLNMQKYIAKKYMNGKYELYAVLIHQGGSIWSGHYYCYIKHSNGNWYLVILYFILFYFIL